MLTATWISPVGAYFKDLSPLPCTCPEVRLGDDLVIFHGYHMLADQAAEFSRNYLGSHFDNKRLHYTSRCVGVWVTSKAEVLTVREWGCQGAACERVQRSGE